MYTLEIRFSNTGSTRRIGAGCMYGKVRHITDWFAPSICGVGYVGNLGGSATRHRCYVPWIGMINRCYNPKSTSYPLYGEKGVTVDPRWHSLEKFIEDVPNIEGYNAELYASGQLSLDKDTKQVGVKAKVYSKDTCVFLSVKENSQLASGKKYKATSPNGEVYEVSSLRDFCIEHGLNPNTANSSVPRKLKVKGWKFDAVE